MKIVIHMILTLSIIGIISGGLLSWVNEWAEPKIAEHRRAETERAIFLVQPVAKSYEKVEGIDFELYKVFDEKKNSMGYSLVYEGNGFQGKIRLIVGLKEDVSEIIGFEILEQSETPGLGTKVTEEPFKKQFINLQTTPQINYVKGVAPSKPNEIQAITGATISSKSVVAIINNGLMRLRELQKRGSL
ncbi:MAG: electron transporter RnfG [Ignavibacteria bacterium RBG_13_36_8]|nr:MAG: electron transporter RnfG [Ignavibacteria bacterium RBG_13_36_8]